MGNSVLSRVRAFWHSRNANDSTQQRTNDLEEHVVGLDPGSLPPTRPVPIPQAHETHQGDAWTNTPFTFIRSPCSAENGLRAASSSHADAMGQNTDSDGSPGYEATKPKYEESSVSSYEEENFRSKGSTSGKELYPEVPPVVPRGSPDEEEANAGVQVQHGTCTNTQKRKSREYKSCFSTMNTSTESKDTAVSSRKVQQVARDKALRGQAASNTLRDKYDVLLKQIKPQAIAPSLYSKRIIGDEALEKAGNPYILERERAGGLLQELIKNVEANPEWFFTILQIFEKELVPGIEELRAEFHRKLRAPVAPALHFEVQLPKNGTPPPPPRQRLESYITDLENAYYDTGGSRAVQRIADKCDPQSEAAKTMLMALLSMTPEQPAVVKTVVDQGVPLAFTEDGETPLQRACKSGHSKSLLWLLKSSKECDMQVRTQDGKTLFQLACENGHADVVNVLLAEGSTSILNLKDEEGNTPLHTVCGVRHGAKPEDTFILLRHREMTENLVKHGARMDISNKDGNTPLHLASRVPNLEALQILLQYATAQCIDLTLQNSEGFTPLHLASMGGHVGAVKALTRHRRSTVDAVDKQENKPLHLACKENHSHVAKILVQYMCSQALNWKNSEGDTPLHLACLGNNLTLVRILLKCKGCSPAVRNKSLNTSLHIATLNGNLEIVSELLNRLHQSEFIDERNEDHETAMHIACRGGSLGIVKKLKGFGASKRIKNEMDLSPADVAEENEHVEIVRYLRHHSRGRRFWHTRPRNYTVDLPHLQRTYSQVTITSTTSSPL